MDWSDLRYLLAAERTGSIAGAAKALKVTKATASRRLAALEQALGARLFERGREGLTLTLAGQEALAAAQKVDAELVTLADRVAAASDARPQGVVRLTAPPWLAARFVIPALPELKARYPEVEVELAATNSILNLADRAADSAIRNVWPTQKSLAVQKLVELGGSVYASELYLERRGTPRSRADLPGHDVLVYETLGGMPGFEWLREPDTGASIAFRTNDPTALVGAATAGLGLAAVPCLLGDPEPALRRVPGLGFARCDLLLVTAEAARGVARTKVVTAFLVELMQRHRAQIAG